MRTTGENWYSVDLDDSRWQTPPPSTAARDGSPETPPAVSWYRQTLLVPEE